MAIAYFPRNWGSALYTTTSPHPSTEIRRAGYLGMAALFSSLGVGYEVTGPISSDNSLEAGSLGE
jgi:hypothetical protein